MQAGHILRKDQTMCFPLAYHQALHKQEVKAKAELSAVWLSAECMSQHTHIHTVHLQILGYFFF